ncbi:MAG: DUF4258 domain-containing protein [Verrucomicrobiota bacterium]|jgi:hypothetical protein
MKYQLTQHARTVVAERNIRVEWMERALTRPTLTEPSATDATLESRFVRIPEHGDRVLRVVVNKQAVPERVVSVYFDRMMKGKL